MLAFSRVLVALVTAMAGVFASLFVGTGVSHAGLDNELSLVDGQDCCPSLSVTMLSSSVVMMTDR